MRSLNAELNRLEREAQRQARLAEKEAIRQERMHQQAVAAAQAESYERKIHRMHTVHTRCLPAVKWDAVLAQPAPTKPQETRSRELAVSRAIDAYKPSALDRLLKRVERKREELQTKIGEATATDAAEFKNQMAQWEDAQRQWKEDQKLARGVLAGDINALEKAVLYNGRLSQNGDFTANLRIGVIDRNVARATLEGFDLTLVPTETQSLLKSGKLSVKDMPKRTHAELVQDFVCGSAIRIANELFAQIPVNLVVVTVTTRMVNKSTGPSRRPPYFQ